MVEFAVCKVSLKDISENECFEFLKEEALKIIDENEPEYLKESNHGYIYTEKITKEIIQKFNGDVDFILRIILPDEDEYYGDEGGGWFQGYPSYEEYLKDSDYYRVQTLYNLFNSVYVGNRTYGDELTERFEEWFLKKYITEDENYSGDSEDKEELMRNWSALLSDADYKPYWERIKRNIIAQNQEAAQ